MTNWKYREGTARLRRVLEAEGVIDALKSFGASAGDLVSGKD